MKPNGCVRLIGTSPAITSIKTEIELIARSDAKVLITGESGVGKEVVARAINDASPRSQSAFVAVNCAGIPETLLESELFGHVTGSFTGAHRDKPGKLELADNGTIFLDEIGETTLRMQGLLLRFLETGEIQKVGAERIGRVSNVRIIAATNRKLRDLIAQGQFREDLFYRLHVIHLDVPPLRDRREDIPALAEYFLHRHTCGGITAGRPVDGNASRYGDGTRYVAREISPEALAVLRAFPWPGNVRQLENVIERLVVTTRRPTILVEDLGPEFRTASSPGFRARNDGGPGVADDLFRKLVGDNESFWTTVYPLYMNREITRGNVRDLVHKGLKEARGNYRILLKLFNMESRDYRRFLNFLRKHECQLPFKEYRAVVDR